MVLFQNISYRCAKIQLTEGRTSAGSTHFNRQDAPKSSRAVHQDTRRCARGPQSVQDGGCSARSCGSNAERIPSTLQVCSLRRDANRHCEVGARREHRQLLAYRGYPYQPPDKTLLVIASRSLCRCLAHHSGGEVFAFSTSRVYTSLNHERSGNNSSVRQTRHPAECL